MPKQPLIVGNPVFVVVDMQEGGGMSADDAGIPVMPGHAERVERTERLLAAARVAGVPVVFFQEVHRPSGVDFGRELDGVEGVHCVEGQPGTDLEPSLRPLPGEFHIVKRRYSGFIGTEFDIVLRGLKASTLILVGGLTDVCVHYTFADAHQRDYYVRVVTDCVGGSSQYRHDAALDAMEYLQTGALRTTDEILAAFAALASATPDPRRSHTMTTRARAMAAVAAVAILALSACGGSDSGTSTPNAAPTDKVLHLSFLQDPGQPPDPDIFYAGQGLLLTTNTYEGLLQYKAGTDKPELEPLLATEWTASPDNKVFTFKLREGVKFHDGTPFTSAAVKASFDRRVAVNQGPAYMVTDVESVTTQGDYGVTVTLKAPNSAFLDYLACPYGPRMLSPEGLKKNAGTDNAQGYLTNHDLGTGPFTLTAAEVGSRYALDAFPDYWGPKPYFQKVEIPVITDVSAQQLQFNNGQVAAILHDLPSSAVQSYLDNKSFANYSLPTMMSNYLYINPHKGMMTDAKNRTAVMQAIDVDELVKQTYFGRGKAAEQIYPTNMMTAEFAKQSVPHDPSVLTALAGSLPADQKAVTIGYDSSNPDNQLVSNLIQTQLAAAGLTAKVQAYPTSETFAWIGTDGQSAPDIFAALAWPDAPSPYTWGHISWDPSGGLNYLGCSAPPVTDALAKGLPDGSPLAFSQAGEEALKTGCWLNIADVNDFVVAQPWLKGVEQAHVVTNPNSLRLAALSVG